MLLSLYEGAASECADPPPHYLSLGVGLLGGWGWDAIGTAPATSAWIVSILAILQDWTDLFSSALYPWGKVGSNCSWRSILLHMASKLGNGYPPTPLYHCLEIYYNRRICNNRVNRAGRLGFSPWSCREYSSSSVSRSMTAFANEYIP